jgi:hypothetical protein
LVIEVSDSGAGISRENQSQLFYEIVQFDVEILETGRGSGLGLWLSKGTYLYIYIYPLHPSPLNPYPLTSYPPNSYIIIGIMNLHGGSINEHSYPLNPYPLNLYPLTSLTLPLPP